MWSEQCWVDLCSDVSDIRYIAAACFCCMLYFLCGEIATHGCIHSLNVNGAVSVEFKHLMLKKKSFEERFLRPKDAKLATSILALSAGDTKMKKDKL